jgi:hypothetical protein
MVDGVATGVLVAYAYLATGCEDSTVFDGYLFSGVGPGAFGWGSMSDSYGGSFCVSFAWFSRHVPMIYSGSLALVL